MIDFLATPAVVSLLAGLTVMCLLLTLYAWLRPAPEDAVGVGTTLRRRSRSARGGWLDALASASPRAPKGFRERFQPVLNHAGFQHPDQVDGFFALVALSILLGLVWAAFVVPSTPLSPAIKIAWTLAGPLAGYVLPVFWLRARARERQAEISRTLPDALDLVKICLDAGLGMEPAMTRVGEELVRRDAALGHELVLTSHQIQAGRTRAEALRALASRCGVPELSNVVTLLNQTERLGMGVGDVLGTAADTSRTRRLQRAEAEAARTSVKMIFPLALFLLPAMLLVVLGPAFIQLHRGLAPLLGGP